MIDILMAGALVAAGVTVATRRFPHDSVTQQTHSVARTAESDLPCPWCHAATREDDRRCPSCHQPFG